MKKYSLKWGVSFAIIAVIFVLGLKYFGPELTNTYPQLASNQSFFDKFMFNWLGLAMYVILFPVGFVVNFILQMILTMMSFYYYSVITNILVIISSFINGIFLGWIYGKIKNRNMVQQ